MPKVGETHCCEFYYYTIPVCDVDNITRCIVVLCYYFKYSIALFKSHRRRSYDNVPSRNLSSITICQCLTHSRKIYIILYRVNNNNINVHNIIIT